MTPAATQAVAADRATAALFGLAVGDAMGMPSQTLSRARIRALYGHIADFVDADPGSR